MNIQARNSVKGPKGVSQANKSKSIKRRTPRLSSALHRLAWLVFVLSACTAAVAQETMKAAPDSPSSTPFGSTLPESANMENVPRGPGVGTLPRDAFLKISRSMA